MTLDNLDKDETALVLKINQFSNTDYNLRLSELGLKEGQYVQCLRRLPFKGPAIYQISDSVFSLENEITGQIDIKKV